MNKSFHPRLISANETYIGQVVMIDAADEEIVSHILDRGASRVATHHCFSTRKNGDSDLGFSYDIPFISPIIRGVAITQHLNLTEQMKIGITGFEIRLVRKDDEFYVEHGIVFGTLKDFLEEIQNARNETGKDDIVVYYSTSSFDRSGLTDADTLIYMRSILKHDATKMDFKLDTSNHGFFRYIQTPSEKTILGLIHPFNEAGTPKFDPIPGGEQDFVALLVTPLVSTFLIPIFISAIVCFLVIHAVSEYLSSITGSAKVAPYDGPETPTIHNSTGFPWISRMLRKGTIT